MLPVIKVWEMDYSFIIKNYLNPALWNKTWTLFIFKDFVITIKLSLIDTENKKISFKVVLKDNTNDNAYSNSIDGLVNYSLNSDSIKFLIRNINGTIYRLINLYERAIIIRELPSYQTVRDLKSAENERLVQFAEDFLDENGVTNEEIREVYIDNYVDNNSKADDYEYDFKNMHEYHHLTDLYLVFLKSVKDENRYQNVLNRLEEDERDSVMKEISELQTYIETDAYEEDMKSELESI